MAHWEGHKTTTSEALLDAITTAAAGARPSHSDRILFFACEFWASARKCSLLAQLREDPLSQLQAAEAAFTEIGLASVAQIVLSSRYRLLEGSPLPQIAKEIENSLSDIDEPVDRMIAAYAYQHVPSRH